MQRRKCCRTTCSLQVIASAAGTSCTGCVAVSCVFVCADMIAAPGVANEMAAEMMAAYIAVAPSPPFNIMVVNNINYVY
jgi:hypothetical protein